MRRYTNALIVDLCHQYPGIDGIRPDWPEYPQYLLDDAFLDFSPAAESAAQRLGFSFQRMRKDTGELYSYVLGRLTNRGSRDLSCGRRELVPNAFPPPFTIASGMDYSLAAKHSSGISVKLYTMHWPMIVRFYGDALLAANRGLSDHLLAAALVRLMDIADGPGLPRIADYAYPDPDTPHPVGREAQARKIRQAQTDAGSTPVYALVHGYGPLADFKQRLKVAWEASKGASGSTATVTLQMKSSTPSAKLLRQGESKYGTAGRDTYHLASVYRVTYRVRANNPAEIFAPEFAAGCRIEREKVAFIAAAEQQAACRR